MHFLLPLLLSLSIDGEAPLPPPPLELVVTVEREAIPRDEAAAAVTLLDRKDIEQLPATSLPELLAFVPGITMMFESGASGRPMITSRGFFGGGEVEYVKLLVDGVPAGDAESGNIDWRRFRAAELDRIELLHGPGSSLYGDTALGGVVQLFTREGEPGHGELMLRGGTFDTREIDAAYTTALGPWRLALRAADVHTGGFREHARAGDRVLQLSGVRTTDQSRWRLHGEASRNDRREPGPLTRDEIDEDRTQSNPLFQLDRDRSDRRRVSATYESFGTTELLATIHASDRDGDSLRTLLLAPGFGTSALRMLSTRTWGATIETARELSAGTIRVGADLDRSSLRGRYGAEGVTASQRGRRDRIGLFLTGGWNVCARCRLSAGLRRDELRDDFSGAAHDASAWSPRAGLNVRLGDTSLFVQASRAFKAPTLDQLFDPRPYPDGSGGTFTISNPALRPQRARNLEAGVTRSNARLDFSLVAYRMNVTDEIDFDPQTYSYRNIGSSLHRGIETSVGLAKASRLSPRVTYAWTRVANAETPDRQLKNIPEHVAQLLLHAQLARATTLDLVYRWTGGVALDDDALFETPGVSRVDLRLAHEIARVRLQLDVLNAFDARYDEVGFVLFDFLSMRPAALAFPAPGRMVRAGATWRF